MAQKPTFTLAHTSGEAPIRVIRQDRSLDENQWFAGLTLDELARAMLAGWKSLPMDSKAMLAYGPSMRHIKVSMAADTHDKFDLGDFCGMLMFAPFDSEVLVAGQYGDNDAKSVALGQLVDGDHQHSFWKLTEYPDEPAERLLVAGMEKLGLGQLLDEDGKIWCRMIDCVKKYVKSLPKDRYVRVRLE